MDGELLGSSFACNLRSGVRPRYFESNWPKSLVHLDRDGSEGGLRLRVGMEELTSLGEAAKAFISSAVTEWRMVSIPASIL